MVISDDIQKQISVVGLIAQRNKRMKCMIFAINSLYGMVLINEIPKEIISKYKLNYNIHIFLSLLPRECAMGLMLDGSFSLVNLAMTWPTGIWSEVRSSGKSNISIIP